MSAATSHLIGMIEIEPAADAERSDDFATFDCDARLDHWFTRVAGATADEDDEVVAEHSPTSEKHPSQNHLRCYDDSGNRTPCGRVLTADLRRLNSDLYDEMDQLRQRILGGY